MSFKLLPLTEADLLDWSYIHYAAFRETLSCLWHSKPNAEGMQRIADARAKGLNSPGSVAFKVVDTDANKTVAVATWKVRENEITQEELEASLVDTPFPPEINSEARNAFMAGINLSRREIMGTQPCILLGSLTVLPEYQRRGVGSICMRWGVDEMDRLGLRGYLEASKPGRGLYEKFGFVCVRDIEFDTRPYGGDYTDVHKSMIREPKVA